MTGTTETITSRNIPHPIQREVRQRCGFGCVICGGIIYDYDHLVDWASAHTHVADEITLLCTRHHREKTNKLLPLADVLKHNADPYNLREGVSEPHIFHYSGDACEVVMGNNVFKTAGDVPDGATLIPLVIDDEIMLGFVFEAGQALLHMAVFDEFNRLILRIERNVMTYTSAAWDVELVGARLRIRERLRRFLIEIYFEPPNRIRVTRGRFLLNGVEVTVSEKRVLVTNTGIVYSGNRHQDVAVCMALGRYSFPVKPAWHFEALPRVSADATTAADSE